MSTTSLQSLATATQLARRFGVSPRQFDYGVITAGVEATVRVGHIRLFDAEAAERIGAALELVRSRRGGCCHANT